MSTNFVATALLIVFATAPTAPLAEKKCCVPAHEVPPADGPGTGCDAPCQPNPSCAGTVVSTRAAYSCPKCELQEQSLCACNTKPEDGTPVEDEIYVWQYDCEQATGNDGRSCTTPNETCHYDKRTNVNFPVEIMPTCSGSACQ